MIPDEQAAIEAALRMGHRGDLMLIFADKISRSWKQVIYFKPEIDGEVIPGSSIFSRPSTTNLAALAGPSSSSSLRAAVAATMTNGATAPSAPSAESMIEGAAVIEDSRGVRLARENDD